jgi:TolB-like protein
MNPQRIITAILCVFLCAHAHAQVQDMDKELSDLAGKLATQITGQGKKKVAVLDFTDLQGGSSELGKYIAEQLTVNLVMGKRDFSVLDRANLKSILAEHKLTATGLVDPENAKKLGMFAGVDALILGTIIPKGPNTSLNAKIITTDTAEIVGAARAEFVTDNTVQQLAAKPAKPEDITGASQSLASPTPKPFGDLEARVESLKFTPYAGGRSSRVTFSIIITNMSESDTYGVALKDTGNRPGQRFLTFDNERGDSFYIDILHGAGTVAEYPNGFRGSLTEVLPRNIIIISIEGQVEWNGKPGDYRPYRLQTEVVYGKEIEGRYTNLKTHNLVLDVK